MSTEALQLLKLSLSHELYEQYKSLFLDEFFPRPIDKLWNVIKEAHEEYKRDVTEDEVLALVFAKNGTLTTAMKNNLGELLEDVKQLSAIGNEVALEVLKAAHKRELGRAIIEESYSLIEGRDFDQSKVQTYIDQISDGCISKDHIEEVPTSIEALLQEINNGKGWSFNLKYLHEKIPQVRPGEFAVFFARPEIGKTAFWISLACGAGGWCDQGANVYALCNEEFAKRNMARAVSCASSMTWDEIKANPVEAQKRWQDVSSKVHMYDTLDWTLDDIDAFCADREIDILIIDQLDKCRTNGPKDQANHERLGDIYTRAREIAKRHNCFVVAISQASNDAQGLDTIDFSMLEGSKTRKAAECDYAIGVGHNSIIEQSGSNNDVNFRLITVSKNKGTGWHGSVAARIDPLRSRYLDCEQMVK